MVKKLVTLFAAILIVVSVFAQVPQKMSYQAIIRNSYNVLVTNKKVSMKISILQNQTPVYVELQTTTTNENGLINVEIGNGIVLAGVFANIDWGKGVYYIKTETDPDGGTYYSIVGTSELLSVPYALYSTASGNGVSIDDSSVSTTKTWSSDKINTELGTKVNSTALATVATTGNFSDLKNKPTTLAGYGITDGGSGTGTGTSQPMSGDATQNATGVVKISNNAITSAKIMDGAVQDQDLDKANIPLSGFAVPEANISMGGYKLTNLSDPTNSKDATTKYYVDNAISNSSSSGSSTYVPIMSLDNNMNLSMRGGNAVSLADLYQSLSLAGTVLSISGPRDSHVDLAAIIAAGSGGGSGVVSHDATLTGTGTSSSVLGIAPQAISPTKMTGIFSNGNFGQVLTSTGNGSFSWTDPASGSGGGLSSVIVNPGNGITASVSNILPTSTITLGLGAISPSSITTSGTITTTGNLNAADITATTLNGSLNASNLTGTLRAGLFGANTIPTTALAGNGAAPAGSFLRGDGTWAVPASGGISNVSVTTNAGVSGVVNNPTTAPAIALTLGDITPTSVTTGAITATGLKLTTGASNGYVLKTDNAGNASWQSASSSYKGMWNAATNTPLITNGVGSNGDYYVVSTSGSYGGTAFTQGGQAVYNGTSGKWESIAAIETDPMVKAINGMVKSDGTTITAAIPGTDYLLPTGNVATSTVLQTGRTISITGDIAYTSPAFNGSANVTAAGTIANNAVTYGKMQAMTANKLLGSGLAGTAVSEINLGTNLGFTGNTLTINGLSNANFSGAAGITDVNLATITTAGKVANSATSATTTNTANTIALRDATGGITATTFTGALTGNVTGNVTGNATTATTASNIAGGGAGIVYQSAANTTTQILNSSATAGNVLTWTGGPTPIWQAPAAAGIASITSANGITATPSGNTVSLSLGAINPTSVSAGSLSSSSSITATGLITGSSLKITTGAQNGYVLKSDASGNATWNPAGSSYNGMWDASTNTPALANGVGSNGDYYVVSVAGSPAALGGLAFTKGGQAVYNGTTNKWESISAVEADPMVKAINGMVKSDGTTISAAVAGTDYLLPTGSAALLTGWPTFNQNTSGNAATATTAANMSGGLGGQILYQSAAGLTSKLANGTAGQVLTSAGTTLAPTWAAASGGISAITANSGTTGSIAGSTLTIGLGAITPTSINTGNITSTGTVSAAGFTGSLTGTATGIAGGAGGQILYQSAAGVTTPLANGTAGQVLTSAGGTLAPSWAAAGGGVTAVTANQGTTGSIAGSTITIGLGAITPTSINTPGTVTATGFTGPLTGNASTATTAVSFSGNLAGDVSGPQGTTVIGTNKVTFAKMQAITPLRLLGSGSGTAISEITLGTNLTLSAAGVLDATAGSGGVTAVTANNGTTGSIVGSTLTIGLGAITPTSINTAGTVTAAGFTGSLTGNATTATTASSFSGSLGGDVTGAQGATVIGSGKVTYGKMQNISTTNVVLGRQSAGAGVMEEIATTGTGNVVRAISPTFTGVPVAPTAAPGTNTTQIATTAFVIANAGSGGATASNGLTASSGNVTLGGTLTDSVTIDQGTYNLNFKSTTGRTVIQGDFQTTEGRLYVRPPRLHPSSSSTITWLDSDVQIVLGSSPNTFTGTINFPDANLPINKYRLIGITNVSGAARLIADTSGGATGIYASEQYTQLASITVTWFVCDGTSWRRYSGR